MTRSSAMSPSKERQRLTERRAGIPWQRWGPYLSERQWATVREDYSADGSAWEYFPHEQARSRAYRWGEDGLLGISDDRQFFCLSIALWNGQDDILKERAFGLTGKQGNHGEDVKDYYYFLDNTPTHSYMRALYKYPHAKFPYDDLVAENARRSRREPEYELIDTGIFAQDRYFDVFVSYAKGAPDDVLLEIEIVNRAAEAATIHVLPTALFRNIWSWQKQTKKPLLNDASTMTHSIIELDHAGLGKRWLYADLADDVLFTENETNNEKVYNQPNTSPYVKDGIHERVVNGNAAAVNAKRFGTKASFWYQIHVGAHDTKKIRLRLTDQPDLEDPLGVVFSDIMIARKGEADEFFSHVNPFPVSDDARDIQRQALAGMLWSKQFYHYSIREWLEGDPGQPKPPVERLTGRNHEWFHIDNEDIISMPDTWEYPWYASWDHAFHMIPFAMIDPDFAKQQIVLLMREWYMHPNGQIPAYEWAFGDANPPVHAWAALRVFRIDRRIQGKPDYSFLERTFQKLLLNFTWWVNRKDMNGNNIFQGGFLGLDNIGIFNRSENLPNGSYLNQSDGTSWMAFYCLGMLAIALELAQENRVYEDIATKFFEHFLYIAEAMNQSSDGTFGLWSDDDSFYLDVLAYADGRRIPIQVHSMVGLIPLLAVETLDRETLHKLPDFSRRMRWFIKHREDLSRNVASMENQGLGERTLLAIVDQKRLRALLHTMLDEEGFLSPYGVRSVSRAHLAKPYVLDLDGVQYRVDYEPGESSSGLFGGNSNWRGPVWFPLNYLLIEALQKFHHYYGDQFTVEYPTGSGQELTLWEVASSLSERMISLFHRDDNGLRPIFGDNTVFQQDANWRDLIPFFEYFHGDNGKGLGASHQTGWTGLVAKLIQQYSEYSGQGKSPLRAHDIHPPRP